MISSAPEPGRILAVLPERTKEALNKWFEDSWTWEERQRVEVVTIDMWEGYFRAALESLPQAL